MSVHVQHPDGSWHPAEPMAYVPGIDWEIGRDAARPGGWTATAYDGDQVLAVVRARGRRRVHAAVWLVHLLRFTLVPGRRRVL